MLPKKLVKAVVYLIIGALVLSSLLVGAGALF